MVIIPLFIGFIYMVLTIPGDAGFRPSTVAGFGKLKLLDFPTGNTNLQTVFLFGQHVCLLQCM